MKADALAVAIDKGAIEDEMRRQLDGEIEEGEAPGLPEPAANQLDGDPIFGSLEGEAPGLPEPEHAVAGPMPGANGERDPAGAQWRRTATA